MSIHYGISFVRLGDMVAEYIYYENGELRDKKFQEALETSKLKTVQDGELEVVWLAKTTRTLENIHLKPHYDPNSRWWNRETGKDI